MRSFFSKILMSTLVCFLLSFVTVSFAQTVWSPPGLGTDPDIDQDSSGNVYIANGSSIKKYSSTGTPLVTMTTGYYVKVAVSEVSGAVYGVKYIPAVGYPDGDLYVPAHYEIARVDGFSPTLSVANNAEIDVDETGTVYVYSSNDYFSSLSRYDSDLSLLGNTYLSGNVYGIEAYNSKVFILRNDCIEIYNSSTLAYIRSFSNFGIGYGELSNPYDIGVDNNGCTYVTDFPSGPGSLRIQKFDPLGNFSQVWLANSSATGGSISINDASYLYMVNSDHVFVYSFNSAPVANAGGPYSGNEGSLISISGSSSSDNEDSVADLLYEWDIDNNQTFGDLTGLNINYTWADNGTYTIGLRVTDTGGLTDTDTVVVTVDNVAPVVDAGTDMISDEGDSVSFSGSFTDVGSLDTHTYSWDFGDGNTASGTLTPTHMYADNGIYTATLTVTDDDGGSAQDTVQVNVGNVVPVVDAGTDMIFDEGDSVSFTGSFTDAGSLDTHIYSWDFGDGSAYVTGTLTPSHIYVQDGLYTAKLTVTDSDGDSGEDTVLVNVGNVAPVVDAGTDMISDEGDSVSFTGSFTDAGSLDTHTYSWDFGDGSAHVTGTLTPSHIYAQDGLYTAKLTVTDSDGDSGEDTVLVNVDNVAPVVDAGTDISANGGEICSFFGSFTDAGSLDAHTYSWNFGDGSALVTDTLSPIHVYTDSGDYTVILTVSDNNGGSGSDALVVTVQNGTPVLTVDPDFEINEGDTIDLVSTSYTDPETGDTHTAGIVWGDGDTAEFPVSGGQISASHRYMNYGDYFLEVTVTDDDGASDIKIVNVKVNRVPIEVSIEVEDDLSAMISFTAIGGKEYDIYYSDDDFENFGSSFNWTLADTVLVDSQDSSGSYCDNGDPDHPGVDGIDGTADDGRLAPYQVETRYYRVVETGTVQLGDPWSSQDVLLYHTKLLYEGRNYVSQVGVCPNQFLNEILDSRFLTGGISMQDSTIVNFWQNNELKNGYVFTWQGQNSWSDGSVDITDDMVDFGRGMILFIKPGQGTVMLPMVGTVCMSDSVDIGLEQGGYSLVTWPYAENMELDNCGLIESGFTGGMSARTADQIYFWDPVSQRYDVPVFYFTATGEWRYYDHTPCTRTLKPGESVLIKLQSSSTCSTWTAQRKYIKSRRNFEF